MGQGAEGVGRHRRLCHGECGRRHRCEDTEPKPLGPGWPCRLLQNSGQGRASPGIGVLPLQLVPLEALPHLFLAANVPAKDTRVEVGQREGASHEAYGCGRL